MGRPHHGCSEDVWLPRATSAMISSYSARPAVTHFANALSRFPCCVKGISGNINTTELSMFMLKLLGALVSLLILYGLLAAFNEHCQKKFSYRFFNFTSFIICAAAIGLVGLGSAWRTSAAAAPDGDVLNGIVLMALGAALAIGLVVYNFKKTDWIYGTGGTLVQLSIFGVLAYVAFLLLFLWAILSFFGALASLKEEPTTVIYNKSNFRVPRL
jgi:hypothetical protein